MWCWPFMQKFLGLTPAMSSAEIVVNFPLPSPVTVLGILGIYYNKHVAVECKYSLLLVSIMLYVLGQMDHHQAYKYISKT